MQSLPSYFATNFSPTSPFPTELVNSNNGSTVIAIPTTTTTTTNSLPTSIKTNPNGTQKRNQVKNACTNCQKACKKCDDARPCPRCIKYGISDTCVNSVRKERKKGIKRGPYKRRQKTGDEKKDQTNYQSTVALPTSTLDPNTPNVIATAIGTTVTSSENTNNTATPTSAAPTTNDFGYPTQLSQYTQTYDAYHYTNTATNSSTNKDVLSTQYVLPVYPSYPPPVLIDGTTTAEENKSNEATEIQENPSESNTDQTTTDNSYLTHQAFNIIHNSTSPEYFQQQQKEQQPLTPVPSTSNSSGTTSPSETHDDDEKFTRLTQLCTAALRENDNKAKPNQQESSSNQENNGKVE